MPVYNSESTIEKSVDSVLNQSYKNLEVIVVMNGCTDKTEEIMKGFLKKDKRVKLFYSEKGLVVALNTGLRHATGDIIARQDSDDEWYEFKLEKQLEQFTDCDILGTQIDIVTSDKINQSNYPLSHENCVNWLMQSQNPIAHPSVIFKKNVIDKVGGYWDLFPLAEDMDLWMRCVPFFKIKNSDFVGMKYNHKHNPNYDCRVPRALSSHYRNLYGIK